MIAPSSKAKNDWDALRADPGDKRVTGDGPRSLRRNFSWTFIGNVIYSVCQWGQLIVLAKLVSPELVGQFAFAFAVTAPIMLAANLGLRTVQVTDAKREYSFGDYMGLRILTVVLALFCIAGATLVLGESRTGMLIIVAIGLAKGLDSLGDVIQGYFQQVERMDPIAKAMIINGVVSLVALMAAVWLTGSVLWGAVGSVFGSAVTLIAYEIPVAAHYMIRNRQDEASRHSHSHQRRLTLLAPRWHAPSLLHLFVMSVPLGFAYMLTSLNPNMPRYFIEHYLGASELGIFAALAYLMVAGHTVMSALSQAALPRLTMYYANGRRNEFRSLFLKLTAFAIGSGVLGVVFATIVGKELLRIVYRPAYAAHADVFVWLTVGMCLSFVIWFLDIGISAARRFGVQVPINLAMIAASVLGSVILIPRYGLVGAAWATCFSLAIQLTLKAVVLQRAMRGLPNDISKDVATGLGPTGTFSFDPANWRSSPSGKSVSRMRARSDRRTPSTLVHPQAVEDRGKISPAPIGHGLMVDWADMLLSFAGCGLILVAFVLSSDQFDHWFVIPVYCCGGLIGSDAVKWLRGKYSLLDPFGLLGLFGLHFFFLAPLLHVKWDYWLLYVDPPADWREWLGKMACINLIGILIYFKTRNVVLHRSQLYTASPRRIWRQDWSQLKPLLIGFMFISIFLQTYIYKSFGGISGYIAAYSNRLQDSSSFQGLGWLFMFSEAFPILMMIGYVAYTERTGRGRTWLALGLVLICFLALRVYFGGLRGSRANYVWPLFWAIGLVHLKIRPIPRKLFLAGVALLILFMYAYGFYKSFGSNAVTVLTNPDTRGATAQSTNRGFDVTVLGDLGRSDVQAFLLYRLTSPLSGSDYQYSWGRSYVGAVALLVPKKIWPNRPPHVIREGTEALFGMNAWSNGHFRASNAYGLAGETMLNFGPLGIPIAFALFGFTVGMIRRWCAGLDPNDSRTLLVPFVLSLSLYMLVWDSDIILYYIFTSGLLPFAIVCLSSIKRRTAATMSRSLPHESIHVPTSSPRRSGNGTPVGLRHGGGIAAARFRQLDLDHSMIRQQSAGEGWGDG